jgi:hypothetical protein
MSGHVAAQPRGHMCNPGWRPALSPGRAGGAVADGGASQVARPRRSGRQRSRSKSEAESCVAASGARGRPGTPNEEMRSEDFFCFIFRR